jgi:hypothetical protein
MDTRQASQLTTGILIVAIGLLLLAGQLDIGWHFGRLWPVIFIVLGFGRYASTEKDGRRGSGGWFLFLGVLFLLHTFEILMLNDSWPLFIVAAGVSIMTSQKDHRAARRPDPPPVVPPGPGGASGEGRFQP